MHLHSQSFFFPFPVTVPLYFLYSAWSLTVCNHLIGHKLWLSSRGEPEREILPFYLKFIERSVFVPHIGLVCLFYIHADARVLLQGHYLVPNLETCYSVALNSRRYNHISSCSHCCQASPSRGTSIICSANHSPSVFKEQRDGNSNKNMPFLCCIDSTHPLLTVHFCILFSL